MKIKPLKFGKVYVNNSGKKKIGNWTILLYSWVDSFSKKEEWVANILFKNHYPTEYNLSDHLIFGRHGNSKQKVISEALKYLRNMKKDCAKIV